MRQNSKFFVKSLWVRAMVVLEHDYRFCRISTFLIKFFKLKDNHFNVFINPLFLVPNCVKD